MDVNTINAIISLISGLIGGNATGSAMVEKSLGTLGNSIAGLIGGGLGGWLMKALGLLTVAQAPEVHPDAMRHAAEVANSIDLSTLIANIAGSGVGGAVLTALAGFLKNATQK